MTMLTVVSSAKTLKQACSTKATAPVKYHRPGQPACWPWCTKSNSGLSLRPCRSPTLPLLGFIHPVHSQGVIEPLEVTALHLSMETVSPVQLA